jgi:hypothetical protein
MRRQVWTPSIVPSDFDQTVYLVFDYFGHLGRAWRQTDVERELETTISDLMTGQYNDPLAVVAFNVAEQWAADVSADIALEIRRRADLAGEVDRRLCRPARRLGAPAQEAARLMSWKSRFEPPIPLPDGGKL